MANDPMDALFGAQVKAGDNQLKNISGLIAAEGIACGDLETAEAMAKEAKERRSQLRNVLIPKAMMDAGVRDFTTDDGIKAKIAFATDGALGSPKTAEEFAERDAKIDLIEAHGGGEIIQMVVSVAFPKHKFDEAQDFRLWLESILNNPGEEGSPNPWHGLSVDKTRTVNHMTLGSWIRSRMGEDDPADQLPLTMLERLGIWYGEIAKITRPKK